MAVSAIELRPRGAVALFDAGIRLTSRNAGVWALALPGGALVAVAFMGWVDAIHHRRDVLVPSLLLTAAWFARGIFQGAACHFVDRTVLDAKEPTVWGSLKEALRRFPSLLVTVAYLFAFNVLSLTLTVGLGFFFLSAHVAGYAVAMQGKGHPLALYQTCSKMLGAARGSATGVRILQLAQVLLMLNLHVAANMLIYLGRKLLGLDLTFAQRFASSDNIVWLAACVAVGFALFEPLKASVASLLVIDGRVRQDGLDLLSAVEQLPSRSARSRRTEVAAVLVAIAAAALALAPRAARAEDDDEDDDTTEAPAAPTAEPIRPPFLSHDSGGPHMDGVELRQRFGQVARHCGMQGTVLGRQLDAVEDLAPSDHSSLTRLLEDVESTAYDDDNCALARTRLRKALPMVVQARDALQARETDALAASQSAKRILARPEFEVDPERVVKPKDPDKPTEPPGWLRRFFEWLGRQLDKLFSKSTPSTPSIPSGGTFSAHLLVIALVAGVLIVLVYLLLSSRRKEQAGEGDIEVTMSAEAGLSADPQSALSRPPEGWASFADELAARGNFREAVRSLYLALLSKLHRLGAIDYDPASSNWDYFRGFKGRREWLPPFRELTQRFDLAYYGHLPVDADGYRAFRSLTQPVLAADAESGAVGA